MFDDVNAMLVVQVEGVDPVETGDEVRVVAVAVGVDHLDRVQVDAGSGTDHLLAVELGGDGA